jgi:RNA polymerase sigma-70 factor (ECF subfamily)
MDAHESFLRLFLANEAELRAFTASLVRDANLCDDVFQEVALTLWKEFARYDAARPFGPWARGVAAVKVMQSRQKAGKAGVPLSPEAIQAVAEAYDRTEPAPAPVTEGLRHCLDLLPEKSRVLVELRYERALKTAAIAEELGAGVDAVCQALSRLRRRLSDCLRNWLSARGESPERVRGI